RGETLRTLAPCWKKALASGSDVAMTTVAGRRYWLHDLSSERLLKLERDRDVCVELLQRRGVLDDDRRDAVRALARFDSKPEVAVVIEAIQSLDAKRENADSSVVFDLVRQLTGREATELATARGELEKQAISARQPILRQIGFASLVNVDRSDAKAWELA